MMMNRDYKPMTQKSSEKSNPFLSGFIVGLVTGVILAAGLTIYLKIGDSPFTSKNESAEEITADKNVDKTEENKKNRFDFYNILPSNESKVTEQEIKQMDDADNAKPQETFFLQVGAFQTEQEADNLKAKLALLGIEAIVQSTPIQDKGVLHRVRVGPFVDMVQVNKAKANLAENGFKADLIKVNNP
jgi:cell division protein FtsN